MAVGLCAQDKKVEIKSISASSYQNGENASYAIDGKTGTIWHSAWNGTQFPVTVTITFAEVSHVDYLRYIPRQDGNVNGNWDNVTVAYSETAAGQFQKIDSYKLGGSSDAYEFRFPEGGLECAKVRFTISSGKNNFASAAEIEAYAVDKTKQLAFEAYFEDELYTVLKPEVTSSEGIEDADVKALEDNLLTPAEAYKTCRVGE